MFVLRHIDRQNIFVLRCSICCASVTVSIKFCSCLVSRWVSAASWTPENLLYEECADISKGSRNPQAPLKDTFPEKSVTLGVWAGEEKVMTEEERGLV